MKLNKKIVAINVLATFLIAETAMAGRIQGVPAGAGTGNSSTPGNSSRTQETISTSPSTTEKVDTVISNTEEKCSSDMDQATSFPQALFSEISRDTKGLEVSVRDSKIFVKIPPVINVCGEFKPTLQQSDATKNISIYMELYGPRKERTEVVDGVEKIIPAEKNAKLTYKEFEDCLIEKKILVDGKIEHSSLPLKYYSGATHSAQYKFDKAKDIKKTVTVSFAHANEYDDDTLGYGPVHAYDNRKGAAVGSCTRAETIGGKELTYINKGEDTMLAEIYETCKNGTSQQIAEWKKSVGNAESLKDIADKIMAELDVGYLVKARQEAEENYKKLNAIGSFLGKDLELIDEATAKKKIKEYEALITDLDDKLITPALKRLDFLVAERLGIEDEDSPRIKEIDAEIKILNKDIKGSITASTTGNAFFTMKKFALTDSAEVVASVTEKSRHYAQVYPGRRDERGAQLTFEQANKAHAKGLDNFKKVAKADWADLYMARKGEKFPIEKALKERAMAEKKLQARVTQFDKTEAKNYQKSCKWGMTPGCKKFLQGRDKRYNQQYKSLQKGYARMSRNDMKIAEMSGYYEEYKARNPASEEQEYSDEYEEYDTLTYDESDFFGQAGGNAYNPNYFNMQGNGNGNSLMPNNQMQDPRMLFQQQNAQSMYMPQLQAPQMMMPQQQGGMWPGI